MNTFYETEEEGYEETNGVHTDRTDDVAESGVTKYTLPRVIFIEHWKLC